MPFTTLSDLDLYYEIHGEEDAPWAMHISGTGNDLRVSRPDLHYLNRAFRVVHYDQRGLGQTSIGDHEPTMFDFADDAAALLTKLGINACPIVGTSFGGMVAQHVAIRHPNRVTKLVLNCTSPGGPTASYPIDELEDLPDDERARRWLKLFDTRADYDAEKPLPGLGRFGAELRDNLGSAIPAEQQHGRLRQLEARRHHDATGDLHRITAPTLVCAGRYDGIVPMRNNEALAAGIPDAALELFDGGHLFMLQDRTAPGRAIDFLTG